MCILPSLVLPQKIRKFSQKLTVLLSGFHDVDGASTEHYYSFAIQVILSKDEDLRYRPVIVIIDIVLSFSEWIHTDMSTRN